MRRRDFFLSWISMYSGSSIRHTRLALFQCHLIRYSNMEFWSDLLQNRHPPVDAKPDISMLSHHQFVGFRPKKVGPGVTAAFSSVKYATTDQVLYDRHDKQIRPLRKLTMSSLDATCDPPLFRRGVGMPMTSSISIGIADSIRSVHCPVAFGCGPLQKNSSFMALGLTEYEATSGQSILDAEDMQLLKKIVVRL